MSSVGIGDDVKVALQSFLRTPWAVAEGIVFLALGTGLKSAVLAVTYGILLRPLPYPDVSRLVVVQHDIRLAESRRVAPEDFGICDDLTAFATGRPFAPRNLGEPRIVRAAFVSREFFRVLGVEPAAAGSSSLDLASGVVLTEQVVKASGIDARRAEWGRQSECADGAFSGRGPSCRQALARSRRKRSWSSIPAKSRTAPRLSFLRNSAGIAQIHDGGAHATAA